MFLTMEEFGGREVAPGQTLRDFPHDAQQIRKWKEKIDAVEAFYENRKVQNYVRKEY